MRVVVRQGFYCTYILHFAGDGQGPEELLPGHAKTDPRQDTRIHVDTGAVQRIQELKEETNSNGNELNSSVIYDIVLCH